MHPLITALAPFKFFPPLTPVFHVLWTHIPPPTHPLSSQRLLLISDTFCSEFLINTEPSSTPFTFTSKIKYTDFQEGVSSLTLFHLHLFIIQSISILQQAIIGTTTHTAASSVKKSETNWIKRHLKTKPQTLVGCQLISHVTDSFIFIVFINQREHIVDKWNMLHDLLVIKQVRINPIPPRINPHCAKRGWERLIIFAFVLSHLQIHKQQDSQLIFLELQA